MLSAMLSYEEEDRPDGAGRQVGFPTSPFYSGSQFRGYQQSKGNKYQVEVILQVRGRANLAIKNTCCWSVPWRALLCV